MRRQSSWRRLGNAWDVNYLGKIMTTSRRAGTLE